MPSRLSRAWLAARTTRRRCPSRCVRLGNRTIPCSSRWVSWSTSTTCRCRSRRSAPSENPIRARASPSLAPGPSGMIRQRPGGALDDAETRPIAFPFAARRDRAVGIRLIQELRKRLDVGSTPRYSGLDSARDLLSRAALADLDADTAAAANPLTTFFARRAAAKFPSRQLIARDPASLPDRATVLADAERVCRGDWEVFGHRVTVDVDEPSWRSHPISARQTAAERWHRVQYLHGETGGGVKVVW